MIYISRAGVHQEVVMKRNESKTVFSVIAAAIVALAAAGCASVPSTEFASDHVQVDMPIDRGTGTH